jgi:hypothetical protein
VTPTGSRTALAVCLITILIGACRGDRMQGPPRLLASDAEVEEWQAFVDDLPIAPDARAQALEARRAEQGILMAFRAGSDTAAVSRLRYRSEDGACGSEVYAFARDLAEIRNPAVAVETALEVDSTGRELTRWPLPANVAVLGVRGSELLVSLGPTATDVYFVILPGGTYTIESGDARVSERGVWPFDMCPDAGERGVCEEFIDDGRRRMILYPDVCP